METLQIPTINDSLVDFERLFTLWEKMRLSQSKHLEFDFTPCNFLQQNAVAFLGGLVRLAHHRRQTVSVLKGSLKDDVRKNLDKNGFLNTLFGDSKPPWTGNTIPYREDKYFDQNGFVTYLKKSWLQRGWTGTIKEDLKNHISQFVIEAYLNVFDHADSPIGVFSCGQYFPTKMQLKLALVDFGVGIPHNVRSFLGKSEIVAKDAICWAFEEGSSTKAGKIARGLGLKNLKHFIAENGGKLLIFSENGYASVENGAIQFSQCSHGFKGTIVQVTLDCKYTYKLPQPSEFDSNDNWF